MEPIPQPAPAVLQWPNPTQPQALGAFERDRLLRAGAGPPPYLEGDGQLGVSGDSTNDGSHLNDLGASRMADALGPVLRRILFAM